MKPLRRIWNGSPYTAARVAPPRWDAQSVPDRARTHRQPTGAGAHARNPVYMEKCAGISLVRLLELHSGWLASTDRPRIAFVIMMEPQAELRVYNANRPPSVTRSLKDVERADDIKNKSPMTAKPGRMASARSEMDDVRDVLLFDQGLDGCGVLDLSATIFSFSTKPGEVILEMRTGFGCRGREYATFGPALQKFFHHPTANAALRPGD